MARLTRKHRQAIARGVRRYWRRVKTESRTANVSIREARTRLKAARLEVERQRQAKRPIKKGWSSPDPEGEVAFSLKDRDEMEPPPWTPRLYERFKGYPSITIRGYWEYRRSPEAAPVADDYETTFDPGSTELEFWSSYFQAIRDVHDETLETVGAIGTAREDYERFGIFVTSLR